MIGSKVKHFAITLAVVTLTLLGQSAPSVTVVTSVTMLSWGLDVVLERGGDGVGVVAALVDVLGAVRRRPVRVLRYNNALLDLVQPFHQVPHRAEECQTDGIADSSC